MKESRNPKTDQTQAEALKGAKPDRNPNERKPITKKEYTQPETLKGVNPDRNPNERRPYGKKEYSDTETLKEGKGKLERKPKP